MLLEPEAFYLEALRHFYVTGICNSIAVNFERHLYDALFAAPRNFVLSKTTLPSAAAVVRSINILSNIMQIDDCGVCETQSTLLAGTEPQILLEQRLMLQSSMEKSRRSSFYSPRYPSQSPISTDS